MKTGYIMTRRFNRPTTFQGTRIVKRPGNVPDGIERIDIPFKPMQVTYVDDDIDMSASVESGWIFKSRAPKAVEPEEIPESLKDLEEEPDKEPEDPEDEDPGTEVGDDTDVEADADTETDGETDADAESDDDGADADDDTDVDDVDDDDEDEAAYELLEDGSYQCLICKAQDEEKILKTESGMLAHIESKHQ